MSLRAYGHYVYVVDVTSTTPSNLINTDHIRRGLLIARVSSVGHQVDTVKVGECVLFAYCAGDDIEYASTIGILVLDEKILCTTHNESSLLGRTEV